MSRYIDADALIQLGLQDGAYEYVSVQEIADFPAADVVEVVHGEWIYNKISQLWECSACHEKEIRTTPYCPHCGANMRDEEDEKIY